MTCSKLDPRDIQHDDSGDGLPLVTASPRECYEEMRSSYRSGRSSIDLIWVGVAMTIEIFTVRTKKMVACRRHFESEFVTLWTGDDCEWDSLCESISEQVRLQVTRDVLTE